MEWDLYIEKGENNMGFIIDALGVMNVFDEYEYDEKYSVIYHHSNEKLKDVFSKIDVRNKDVLTILGSGDQAFYLYDNGARSVDMFDRNKLAIYYYYLRTWVIIYYDLFYPGKLNKKYIKTLLGYVKPRTKEEKSALRFWKMYTKIFTDEDTEILFSFSNDYGMNDLDDVSEIRKRIDNGIVSFHNVDISKSIDINKKYDIIFTSNVADYILQEENQLKLYRDNLNNLLKNDGSIIRCNVINGHNSRLERRVFLEKFDSQEIPSVSDKKTIGFLYTKK